MTACLSYGISILRNQYPVGRKVKEAACPWLCFLWWMPHKPLYKIVKVSINNYKLQGSPLSQKVKYGAVPGSKYTILSCAHSFCSLSIALLLLLSFLMYFMLCHVLLIISLIMVSASSLGLVEVTGMFWIAYLFLIFHIAHNVIVMKIRNLSESIVRKGLPFSSVKVSAPIPRRRPIESPGHLLLVVWYHRFLVVFQACSWPLCSHSSHRWCSDSSTVVPCH